MKRRSASLVSRDVHIRPLRSRRAGDGVSPEQTGSSRCEGRTERREPPCAAGGVSWAGAVTAPSAVRCGLGLGLRGRLWKLGSGVLAAAAGRLPGSQ